jgi:hypothetical protein
VVELACECRSSTTFQSQLTRRDCMHLDLLSPPSLALGRCFAGLPHTLTRLSVPAVPQ